MKIGSQAGKLTAISASNPDSIVVRGFDLCADLIGAVTFTDHVWLLVAGQLPSPGQRRILDATLVGFRCPATVQGYDLVGYHWHVLSADRTKGGHLLECALVSGRAAFNGADEPHVEIPRGLAWSAPESSAASEAVLKKLESAPGRS